MSSLDEDDPWRLKTLLSLDGGGARGLSTLFILQALMTRIENHENKMDNARGSAHSPLFDALATEEYSDSQGDDQSSPKYLLCHYFDIIGGSSTGGLIAIMLGRLRMSVKEAIKEYQEMCKNVFEKPSSRLKRFLNRYDREANRGKLQSQMEDLANRRKRRISSEVCTQFRSDPERCGTIVCSIKATDKIQELYLFRSYEREKGGEEDTKDTNAYAQRELKIWEVARVASAAPSFYKCVEIDDSRFYDAIVNLNNPSWKLFDEVSKNTSHSNDRLDTLLSVGGGDVKQRGSKLSSRGTVLLTDSLSYPEYVHRKVQEVSKGSPGFNYYRLDVEGGIPDVRLDEWKPRDDGELTLQKIRLRTEGYLMKETVVSQLDTLAKSLVERRISRSQMMRWEAFAAGIRYKCPIEGCSRRKIIYLHRNQLMDHLRSSHHKPPPDTAHYKEIQTLLDQGRTPSS